MAVRNIYLKIESIFDYSPVDPDPASPVPYRRDCMRNMGHEDATIPASEVNARKLTALVYREYLDPNYLVPRPDKIIQADVNEPPYNRRVPGAVLYARSGDRLKIHVLNGDVMPHSLHMHGLHYGIDSDGSWPLGTQAADGRRSDEICPGDCWTYTFDATDETVGAWPFHDHWRHIGDDVNRGLFGGLIVRRRDDPLPPPFVFPHDLRETVKRLVEDPPRVVLRKPGPRPVHLAHAVDPVGHRIAAMKDIAMRGDAHSPDRPFPHPHPGPVPEDVFDPTGFLEMLEHIVHVPHHHKIPRPPAVLHVPLFYHFMSGPRGTPVFDSGDKANGEQFTQVFSLPGTFEYFCLRHGPTMNGTVNVQIGGLQQAAVTIVDDQFQPAVVTIRPGGSVVWTHAGMNLHTVTERGGASTPTYCFNGRAFVGNTPTIEAVAGQRIRWYVFNLDLGMNWHNFHPHAQRWKFGGETIDGRSLGPAESFVVETRAPQVLIRPRTRRPRDAERYDLRGDFLVHCHVEMHMMQGMAGLIRSRQSVWLTPAQVEEIEATTGLPLDPGGNTCPDVDLERCDDAGAGRWEEVPGNPEVTFMHAVLLTGTTKVLYWGYTALDQSRIWDYGAGGGYSSPANQPADEAPPGTADPAAFTNLWSAAHAYLDTSEGTVLAHGGFSSGYRQSFLFHPATNLWELTDDTTDGRFYATTLTLADGKLLTLYGAPPGGGVSTSIEIYTLGTGWDAPIPLPASFGYLFYPWTYQLPGGDLFVAGPTGMSRRFAPVAPVVDDPTRRWPTIAGNRSSGGEKGASVLLPLRPPNYEPRVLIAGGDFPAALQTAELIDLSAPTPAWTSLPNLSVARPMQVNTVLLPDGRVFLAGGVSGGGPVELFDPDDPGAGWALGPMMTYERGYHSAAILLPDGSVLMGGDPQGAGGHTPHERYYPGYFSRPRPILTGAPASVSYGDAFTIQSPHAGAIGEVVLLRPGAVTHGFNMSQRLVGCTITGTTGTTIDAEAPPNGEIAPPGWYLLFILTSGRVPSEGRWIRLEP